jgi:hypothetical protein
MRYYSSARRRSYRREPQFKGAVHTQPITEAFKELRKAGYFARKNFWCCQTCAWADVPDDKGKHAVFYHHQDNDRLEKTGRTMLAWSGNAKFICEVLTRHGLNVKHDGSENTRIEIALPGVDFPPEPVQPVYSNPAPMDSHGVVWA